MRVVGLARIKNESRWITRCLESLKPLCDAIVVLDDHSTDGTQDLCRAAGAEVTINPATVLDEAASKDYLLTLAAPHHPDWCVMLDGDEVLVGAEALRKVLEASGTAQSYMLRFLYLWDREDQIRIDGNYNPARSRRQGIWRFQPGQTFMRTRFGGNFHCGSVPRPFLGKGVFTDAATILHYGYLDKAERLRKYEFYNRLDANNDYEDRYRHFVIGDLFPPDSRFKWGGPLALQPLSSVL